jgi:hypothetical protein
MILRPKFIPVYRYQPETLVYQQEIANASGTISMRSLQHVDKFVRDCKEAGVWEKLYDVMPFAGDQLNAGLIKVKTQDVQPVAYNFVAGDYSEALGLLGNGTTKYLDLQYPATGVPLAGHLASYNREDTTGAAGRYAMGADNGADQFVLLGSTNAGANCTAYIGGTVAAAPGTPYNKGFYYVERTSLTDLKLYRNNTQIGSNAAAITFTPPAFFMYAFARSVSGAAANFLNTRMSFLSVGTNLSAQERSDYYSIVQTLQVNLGRAV